MRDSLIFYTAYSDKFNKLSDEQFGKLVRIMLHYQTTGTVPIIDDPLIELSFNVVKFDMDMNNEKYERVVQRNRENGGKGGRPKNPTEPQKPSGLSGNPTKPKKADNDNENDNEHDNDNEIKRESKAKRFTPPTLEEVQAYCRERKNKVDAERFIDFYASKGWMVGSNKMKDWKACVRTWERRDNQPKETEEDSKKNKRFQKYDELTRYYLGESEEDEYTKNLRKKFKEIEKQSLGEME